MQDTALSTNEKAPQVRLRGLSATEAALDLDFLRALKYIPAYRVGDIFSSVVCVSQFTFESKSMNEQQFEIFLPVDDVVRALPMGKSTFLNGVKSGKFPQPVRFTQRRPVWRKSDIDALIAAV